MATPKVKEVSLPGRENLRVAVITEEHEWAQVRGCLAAAFHDYPLFKRLIPNANTREKFLFQYMEATYDVAVRQGNSVAFSIGVKPDNSDSTILIGGAVYVPPDGRGGWDTAEDDVYFDSYAKHGLREIDPQAFQKLLRYEEWETKNLLCENNSLKLHMWIGDLLGIHPTYVGIGYGSAMYSALMQALGTAHQKKFGKIPDERATANREERQTNNSLSASFMPPVIITCHCPRAANFHKKHGYETLKTVPVCGDICGENMKSPLLVHIMLHEGTS